MNKAEARDIIDQIIITSRGFDMADGHVVEVSSHLFEQLKKYYSEFVTGAISFNIRSPQMNYDLLVKSNNLVVPGTISVTSGKNKEPKLLKYETEKETIC